MQPSHAFVALSLFAAAPFSFAQAPRGATQAPLSAAHGLTEHAGGFAGTGRGYVVDLRADGVAIAPALGARAPETRRLELARDTVRAGSVAIADAGAAPAPTRDGDAVVYALSPTLSERWTVRADGVELAYVLSERPAGAPGDLVVTLRASADLPFVTGSRTSGWTLRDADGSGLFVGAVTGVAADGARAAGWVDVRDGEIELGLPAAFVAGAAYPLVLDPLFGPVFGINASADSLRPATASMDQWSQRLTVWEMPLSAIDVALVGQVTAKATGAPIGGLVTLATSGMNAGLAVGVMAKPIAVDARYVVAYEVETMPGDRDVRAFVLAKDGVPAGTVGVAVMPGVDEHAPDVGSNYNEAAVVWVEGNAGIRKNSVVAGPALAAPIAMVVSSSPLDRMPTVSDGGLDVPIVVWVHDAPAGLDNSIRARLGDGTGNPVTLLADSDEMYRPAAVSHRARDFVVVWELAAGPLGAHDVWGARVRHETTFGLFPDAALALLASPKDERNPALAATEREVALVCEAGDIWDNPLDFLTLDALTLTPVEPLVVLATSGMDPSVAGSATKLATDVEFQVVWSVFDLAAGGNVIQGQLAGDLAGDVDELASAGCDAFAAEPGVGAAWSGSPLFRSELRSAQPGVIALLGVGFSEIASPSGAGTLVAGTPFVVIWVGLTDATGYAAKDVALPPGLAGLTFVEQWALVGGGAPCAAGPYDLTDAVRVTLD